MRDSAETSRTTPEPAVTRRRSEGATLACAVSAAVALGVACGFWINARLAPNTRAGRVAPLRLLPDAHTPAPPAPAEQTSPCAGCETSSTGEATPARASAVDAGGAGPSADSGVKTGGSREAAPASGAEPGRAVEVAEGGAEPRGVTNSGAAAAASPAPSRPVAWEVPLPKAGARANVGRGAARVAERAAGGGARAQSEPCALYASANSLGVRVGGAVPLILGGPGAGVRINVSTPDWSELAVIYEGPSAGNNGWLRYSVRSVGRRPGLYTVRLSTPCGSQTIPVTVK